MGIEIKEDAARAEGSRGRKSFTLLIDGQPSLYWCPTRRAAERVKERLERGRSGEAFGGNGVAATSTEKVTTSAKGHALDGRGKVICVGERTVETVVTKSGREKPREKRPAFSFELDGKHHESIVAGSEEQAKALCAVAAFTTRGKLGKFALAEAAFKDQTGLDCKVQAAPELGGKVVAKDSKGGLWLVGFKDGDSVKFSRVVPPKPSN